MHELGPFAGETHAVDNGFILHQTEDARFRVARLGQRRDRPNFDVTEAQRGQPADGDAILIIPCRQPDRVLESQSKDFHRLLRRGE